MILQCPYFKGEEGKKLRVTCEACSFKMPDKEAMRELLYSFCAHPSGYKSCQIAKICDHYYSRKYGD